MGDYFVAKFAIGTWGQWALAVHDGFRNAIAVAFTISNVDEVAEVVREFLKEETNVRAVRVDEDTGVGDVGLDVWWGVTNGQSGVNGGEGKGRESHLT